MDAIDQRRALGFERLGRSDIGGDHEFLDQTVRIEPGRADDRPHPALVVEQNLALRQVEVERRAVGAGEGQARIGAP